MNDSGEAVRLLARRYGVEPTQIVVVQDELDLPVAVLKLKAGGGLAGHNGLRSIKSHLHSDEFLRVRIGVSKPASKERGADHVLAKFSKRERADVDVTIERAGRRGRGHRTRGHGGRDERLQLSPRAPTVS